MISRFVLFDLAFASAPKSEILEQIVDLSSRDHSSSVIFANAHVVVESQRNPQLKNNLKKSTLVVPDGVPIAWTLKAKGQQAATRYSGPDLMEDLLNKYPEKRHFFLGSTESVLKKIKDRFRGNAVGFYSPPFSKEDFSPEEKQKQLDLVEKSGADFIWVGLGAPKQENYVAEVAPQAARGVWLAVGAAFDFYAGLKPRAPRFIQKMGLEWAFRLASEPKRLSHRYLSTNPAFVGLALKEIFQKSQGPTVP